MSDPESEPVEISTVLRPGEWTEETLPQVLDLYRDRLLEMGAPPGSLVTSLDRADNGSVGIRVAWDRRGMVPKVVEDADRVRSRVFHGLDRIPSGHAGNSPVPGVSGPGFGRLSTPGLTNERIVMYTDDDGTTWLEGRSDSER